MGELVPIDASNWQAAAEVRVADDQLPMVADYQPVALVIMAKALVQPKGQRWEPLVYLDDAGHAVGVLGLVELDDGYVVHNFAIDHTRQRQGHGRAAIEAVLARLRSQGVKRVELTTHPDNVAAAGLYAAVGFEPTGEFRRGEPVLSVSI